MDYDYKLFDDSRLFRITGLGLEETPVAPESEDAAARTARQKRRRVIDRMMQPPLSDAARRPAESNR